MKDIRTFITEAGGGLTAAADILRDATASFMLHNTGDDAVDVKKVIKGLSTGPNAESEAFLDGLSAGLTDTDAVALAHEKEGREVIISVLKAGGDAEDALHDAVITILTDGYNGRKFDGAAILPTLADNFKGPGQTEAMDFMDAVTDSLSDMLAIHLAETRRGLKIIMGTLAGYNAGI